MAADFLEAIYKEADLLCKLKQTVEYTRVHDDFHAVENCEELLSPLCDLCKRYLKQDAVKGMELWTQVQKLTDVDNDLIFLGDVLEYQILPLVQESMKQWGEICTENEEGDYQFESTVSGFLTIKNLKDGRYLHSTVDPMWEAKRTAEYIYDPRNAQYAVRGCGLGYLIYQLYKCSNESTFIKVFEKDARMVEYARQYGVLDWVPKENLEIIVDENPASFLQSASERGTGMYIFVPELYSEKDEVAPMLTEINMQCSTRYKRKKYNAINCWSNLRQNCRMISEFDASHLSEDFIVVAGGPSVDDCMDFLRENMGKKTLIAVGTIFRKLLQADIVPDMVTILDSHPVVYKQIEGLEEQKVPMMLAMEAPWKIAVRYQGEKYLIPTTEMPEISKDFLGDIWEVGGTVTDLALAVAVHFGARRIYLVGVDMAFPGGITHAEGTLQRTKKSQEKLIPVESVNGGVVYAAPVFLAYRRQIEERIAGTPQVAWYNMSRIGAKIAGTVYLEE